MNTNEREREKIRSQFRNQNSQSQKQATVTLEDREDQRLLLLPDRIYSRIVERSYLSMIFWRHEQLSNETLVQNVFSCVDVRSEWFSDKYIKCLEARVYCTIRFQYTNRSCGCWRFDTVRPLEGIFRRVDNNLFSRYSHLLSNQTVTELLSWLQSDFS